jgi:biotin synthase
VRELLSCNGIARERLYREADAVRKRSVGDEIFLRGIIEITNHCRNDCRYCGIRRSRSTTRYRISEKEIVGISCRLSGLGVTTVVLQGGEDGYFSRERVGTLLRRIKRETSLAVTLSLGEQDADTFRYWQQEGMDRYFLRFETSQSRLFRQAHPDGTLAQRMRCLHTLKKLGIQTGSGFLMGLPGQTLEGLAADILVCTGLELDMIGVGPFIPHPATPYGEGKNPFDEDIFPKAVAILRLLNPYSHIPATTGFDAVVSGSRLRLLQQGANVFMPNATPLRYRHRYDLYPGKPGVDVPLEEAVVHLREELRRIGRCLGDGPGHAIRSDATGNHRFP